MFQDVPLYPLHCQVKSASHAASQKGMTDETDGHAFTEPEASDTALSGLGQSWARGQGFPQGKKELRLPL